VQANAVADGVGGSAGAQGRHDAGNLVAECARHAGRSGASGTVVRIAVADAGGANVNEDLASIRRGRGDVASDERRAVLFEAERAHASNMQERGSPG
jgi:hypothetical protein